MRTQPAHVSSNAVQGSLGDVTVGRLLDVCRDQLLTGRVDIHCRRGRGHVELRAGVVHEAVFCGHRGDAAIERMRELGEGRYTIAQRLPGLDGSLGSAASFQGEVTALSLVELMRHCEENALTCNVTIIHEFDRAQIVYRAGEITRVSYNGVPDEDKIVDLVRLRDGRFLVSAPPLEIGVRAAPVVRRAPTEPFRIEHLAQRPPDRAPAVEPAQGDRPSALAGAGARAPVRGGAERPVAQPPDRRAPCRRRLARVGRPRGAGRPAAREAGAPALVTILAMCPERPTPPKPAPRRCSTGETGGRRTSSGRSSGTRRRTRRTATSTRGSSSARRRCCTPRAARSMGRGGCSPGRAGTSAPSVRPCTAALRSCP